MSLIGNSLTGISSTAVMPERLQIGNLLDHAQVGSRCFDLGRAALGETANVHFVDDRFADVAANVSIAVPIKVVVDDDTLGRPNHAVVLF